VEVSFTLQEYGPITIEYKLADSFQERIAYVITLYDTETQEHTTNFGMIMLFDSKDEPNWAVYYNEITGGEKPLSFHADGSKIIVEGLTFSDIGNKYAFYASAFSAFYSGRYFTLGPNIRFIDVEPRDPSGDLEKSLDYHAEIKLVSESEPEVATTQTTTEIETTKPTTTITTQSSTPTDTITTSLPETEKKSTITENTQDTVTSKNLDYTLYYIIGAVIAIFGILVGIMIYRKK